MKRALMVGVVSVFAMFGLLAGSRTATASSDLNVWTPIDTIIDDSMCTGEPMIHITGNVHSVIHTTVTPTGGFHFDSVDNYADVKGIGLTLNLSYVVQDNAHDMINSDGPSLDMRTSDHYRIVSMGAPPNYFLFISMHFVVGPSGPSASADQFNTGCNG